MFVKSLEQLTVESRCARRAWRARWSLSTGKTSLTAPRKTTSLAGLHNMRECGILDPRHFYTIYAIFTRFYAIFAIFTQSYAILHDFTLFYAIFTRFYANFAIFPLFFARHKMSDPRHLKLLSRPALCIVVPDYAVFL